MAMPVPKVPPPTNAMRPASPPVFAKEPCGVGATGVDGGAIGAAGGTTMAGTTGIVVDVVGTINVVVVAGIEVEVVEVVVVAGPAVVVVAGTVVVVVGWITNGSGG